jgi:hypothetical protein
MDSNNTENWSPQNLIMKSGTVRFLSTYSILGLSIGMSADVFFSILTFGVTFSGSRVTSVTITAAERTSSSALHVDRLYGPLSLLTGKGRVDCTLVQTLRLCTGRTVHRGRIGIALLFHDHSTRKG